MNHRMPSGLPGNVNGPPLSVSGMNNNAGSMMESGVPMMHPSQYALANMIPHGGQHLHERDIILGPGIPVGPMVGGPHSGMPHMGPHLMHPHHPHHGHPGLQMYRTAGSTTDSKINEFNRRLQQRTDDCDNIWWDSFITEFFDEDATLTITFTDEGPKRYTIGRTLIPRYFRSIFESGCSEYYYFLRSVRESFHTSTMVVDSESAQMVMTFPRTNPPTTITVDGRLVLDFMLDEMMRIRNWNFQIRSHREFVLRSMPGFPCNSEMQQIRDIFSINLTRCGIPNNTMNFFRICSILEPMQELMSRQKAYSLSPKDCLKTTLFQKWQRMVAPPGQQQKSESNRQTNKRRKRKGSSANSDTASGRSSKRKQSPVPSLPNLNQPGDVMIVGEPTLMGGEFGDEDERSITRLENTQYDTNGNNIHPGLQQHGPPLTPQQQQQVTPQPNMSGPHMGLTQMTNSGGGGPGLGQSPYQPGSQSMIEHQMASFNGANDQVSKPGDGGAIAPLCSQQSLMMSSSSNLNGSLNSLLKSDSASSRLQYPGTCTTPGSKTNCQDPCSDDQQQQQQQSFMRCSSNNSSSGGNGGGQYKSTSAAGGPSRPTSQGANTVTGPLSSVSVAAFQDSVFGFTTDNLCDFSEKLTGSDLQAVTEHQRPISEPLPLISGPGTVDGKGSSCADC